VAGSHASDLILVLGVKVGGIMARLNKSPNGSKDSQMSPDEPSTSQAFFELLAHSFLRAVGRPLVEPGQGAEWLFFDAPFVVVAHNTERDPRFIYANLTAQRCFGYSWDEFTKLPSRLSAEAPDRLERQALLDAVARQGFIANYRGLRVRKSGAHFWMEDGLVWELRSEAGIRLGQAATFSSWTEA